MPGFSSLRKLATSLRHHAPLTEVSSRAIQPLAPQAGHLPQQQPVIGWKLSPELLAEMLAHARTCYPREACGVLVGQDDCVQRHYAARNVAVGNEHFHLDPEEQQTIFAEMARQRWKLLAIYHSHPRRDASPSRNDLRLAAYSQALFLIISLAQWDYPEIRGYQIHNGQALEIPLE